MALKDKFQLAWENRSQIAGALYNTYISSNVEIKEEIARRLSICETNTCGLWDATGQSDKLVVKGKPGCMGCGCTGEYKVACMECHCSLKDLDPPQEPLWEAFLNDEQSKQLREEIYYKQFEKKD